MPNVNRSGCSNFCYGITVIKHAPNVLHMKEMDHKSQVKLHSCGNTVNIFHSHGSPAPFVSIPGPVIPIPMHADL